MQTLGSTKSDAQGRFYFDQDPQGPRIIQAIYSGVVYTRVAPPGAPADNLTVPVYEPTTKAGTAPLAQHMVILQPGSSDITVSENLLFQNASKLTFHDPNAGSAQVFVPEAGRASAKVTITAPGGMPISRDLGETREKGVYKVDYPLKPGETRFEVSYTLPAATPMIFAGRVIGGALPLRLVVPNGVTLKGDSIQLLGQEPTTQATIYNVSGDKYQVEVEGMAAGMPQLQPGEDLGRPEPRMAKPRLYNQLWMILALVLLILTLGGVILWRRGESK